MNLNLGQISSEIVEINKKFANGVIVNKGSLEFALSATLNSKDWHEQLAYVIRALLCDHIFEDGNKRTAVAYLIAVLETFKYRYDSFKIDRLALKIAKNNISNIQTIRRMIEHASAKNI